MPIERLVMRPIERPCTHANRRAWPWGQSKGLVSMPIEDLVEMPIEWYFVLIPIEVPCSDANRSTLLINRKLHSSLFDSLQFGPIEVTLKCQSKTPLFRCQSKDIVKMPIERHLIEGHFDQLQNLLFFFKQVFVTTRVREDFLKSERENFGVQHLRCELLMSSEFLIRLTEIYPPQG